MGAHTIHRKSSGRDKSRPYRKSVRDRGCPLFCFKEAKSLQKKQNPFKRSKIPSNEATTLQKKGNPIKKNRRPVKLGEVLSKRIAGPSN
jgi:hypothetical protein